MPLAPALDTIGVIARHIEDLALMLGLLAGADARDPAASTLPVPDYLARLDDPIRGLRLGIDAAVVGSAHPDVQGMLQRVTKILETQGLVTAACRFPDWQTLDHLVQLTQMPDCSAAHAAYLRSRPNDYGPQVRARLELGHFIGAVDHLTALRARGSYLRRTLEETFKDIDIAILPVLADPLPTIAELDIGGGPTLQAAMARVVKHTRPINYLGLPTLSAAGAPRGRPAQWHSARGTPLRGGAALGRWSRLPARGAARGCPPAGVIGASVSGGRREGARRGPAGRQGEGRRGSLARIALVAGDEVAHAVAAVDVRTEDDAAIRLRPCRNVGEIDGHRLLQVDVERLARIEDLAHPTDLLPARLVFQHPFDHLEDILHTHAARAEGATALIEEGLHGRIVHVDAMLVGHVEAHEAQRILQARVLSELDFAGVRLAPIDVVGVEFGSVEGAGQDPDLLLCR